MNVIRLPIFPLPDVVLFPGVYLPLHIFEPRYRFLVKDVLQSDRRIGMVLLQPGWEEDYYGTPDVYSVGGVGRITEFQEKEDGKYDILLYGTGRFRILDFVQETPYRVAQVKMLGDSCGDRPRAQRLSRDLLLALDELCRFLPDRAEEMKAVRRLDFDVLVNYLCFRLDVPAEQKQLFLEEADLCVRAEGVLAWLKKQLHQHRFLQPFHHLRPDEPGWN